MPISTVALTAFLVWTTYWVRAGAGPKLANSDFLTTLWQVQAAAVSLALALMVFVFGLFPRSGKRISYRTFLRRTSARPVVVWGISSLLLDGIVLLGFGHQGPDAPGTGDGHGWAITVACAAGLVSVASIAVLFGRTIGAIDPVAGQTALTEDRHTVIGEALRQDLLSDIAFGALERSAEHSGYKFTPSHRDEEHVRSPSSARIVHNISLRQLAAISDHARRSGRALPQIHVWLGQHLPASAPMVTVDPATPWLDRHRAQHLVRLRRERGDEATELLDSLHADVLDHIRADRPIDASAGMATMSEILRLAWRADQAQRRPTPVTMSFTQLLTLSTRGFEDAVIHRLASIVRAGAVSVDEQIRERTAQFPLALATLALHARAAASVRACLTLYLRIYEAVISDVTDTGRQPIPLSGVGRQRISQVFEALMSFTSAKVAAMLDSAHTTGRVRTDIFDTDTADFAVEQACAAHTVILAMLRKALQFGDVLSVQRVVPHWAALDADWIVDDLQAPMAGDADEAALADLQHALDNERRELAGMKLRLLRSALQHEAQEVDLSGTLLESDQPSSALPDTCQAVTVVLDNLDPASFWDGLTTATDQADQDIFPPARDDEIRPNGWHTSSLADQDSSLARTFVRAALARPHLVTSGQADPRYANDHATAFIAAATALATHLPWAQRHGTPGDPQQLSGDLIGRMHKAATQARRHLAQHELTLPLPEPESLRQAVAGQYADHEIVIRLFAWAQGTPVIEEPFTGTPIPVTQRHDHREFTAGPGTLTHTTQALAIALAHTAVSTLIAEVSRLANTRAASPQQLGDHVRDAIAATRRVISDNPGQDASASGVVVFVPNEQRIADLLAVSDRARSNQSPRTGPSPRQRMLARLGFDTPHAEWCLLGIIDDVPVVRTPATKTVLVVDLAHGVSCRTNAGPGAQEANVTKIQLLAESEDSARRRFASGSLGTSGTVVSQSADDQITMAMTGVEVLMNLTISFAASPDIGATVLTIDGP